MSIDTYQALSVHAKKHDGVIGRMLSGPTVNDLNLEWCFGLA